MAAFLVLTYAFPPAGGSGVQRTVGLVRHIGQHGWSPVVITARHPINPGWDHELASRVPSGLPVIRTPNIDFKLMGKQVLSRLTTGPRTADELLVTSVPSHSRRAGLGQWVSDHLLIPDDAVGWFPFALFEARRAIKRYGIRAVYSTSPPATNHLVALALKRRTGLPWVADFRDLWTSAPYTEAKRRYRNRWRLRWERGLEERVLSVADQLLTVTEPFKRSLVARVEPHDAARFRVIPNGFDPELTDALQRDPPSRFTMTYTGRFYGRHRSPEAVLKAIANLIGQGLIDRNLIRVRFIGASEGEVRHMVRGLQLEGVVSVRSQVPHGESLQEQINASLLLLIVGPDPGERDAVPGKVYEYLAARRPILGMVPTDSPTAALIEETGAGVVVDADNDDAIEKAILDSFGEFIRTGDVEWRGRIETIDAYSRSRLARDFAAVLETVTQPGAEPLRERRDGESNSSAW